MRIRAEAWVDGETAIYGIIGHPVGHSLSPLLHNAAFRAKSINALYAAFDVPRADAGLRKGILALGVRGLSVTIPHKGWAAKTADSCDEMSRKCGAANTLVRRGNKLEAFNTDAPGAVRALTEKSGPLAGSRILVVGYGGSATAIAHGMLGERPDKLIITGRNKAKCRRFVESVKKSDRSMASRVVSVDPQKLASSDVDIIIQTTPLGMKGKATDLPVPEPLITDKHIVFDIVYNPPRTPILALAEKRGARTVPGYMMLLYQAVLQFELFTGEKAPESLMERELLRAIKRL